MRVLVLYTRLTGYWMACMRNDHRKTGNEYLVIRRSPSDMAPFKISSEEGIEIINGDDLDSNEIISLAKEFDPDLLYVSGWGDKRYRMATGAFRKKNVPVILGMDNHWQGSFRQKLASVAAPVLRRKYFSHIWIPGTPQYHFARKLGFEGEEILTGLYCADEHSFKGVHQDRFRKQITFIGRLVEHKGLKILFEVLEILIANGELNMEVHIIGSGPLEKNIPEHKLISHTGFVDPGDLPEKLHNAGFFVLPSLYEAWGVVMHEAVLAGLPVISTQETGATSEFLIDGYNGYQYPAMDVSALLRILRSVNQLSEEEYLNMSVNSKHLASRISPDTWSATLNSVLKTHKN